MKATRTAFYCLLVAIGAAALGQAWPDLVGRAAYAYESGQAVAARAQLKHARDLSSAFQEITRAVRPSVVNIRSIRQIDVAGRMQRLPFPGRMPFDHDLFEHFFRQREPRVPDGGQQYVQRGLGTGVIVSEDGYVVTNNHVVADATRVTVTLSDERVFDAEVIGTDEKTDLAVLKINAPDLLPVELADSDKVSVGEWALAMGTPFGLAHTVTAGIISATGRSNVGIADYEDFLQTDAAINPGNSGGPLLNLDGQVIGINTAIATRTGSYQGIGFAIPANMVRQVMQSIVDEGKVVRGWLGVSIQNLTRDLSRSFDYAGTDGVLVGDVIPDGPADRGGLRAGDIIVSVNGTPATDISRFRNRIAATKPGAVVDLEVARAGETRQVTIEIGELESPAAVARSASAPRDLGMRLQNLSPELARRLGLAAHEQGLVVTEVAPAGPAEDAGVRPGDLLLAVGGQPVSDLATFRTLLSRSDLNRGVRLRLKTDGMQRYVILKK